VRIARELVGQRMLRDDRGTGSRRQPSSNTRFPVLELQRAAAAATSITQGRRRRFIIAGGVCTHLMEFPQRHCARTDLRPTVGLVRPRRRALGVPVGVLPALAERCRGRAIRFQISSAPRGARVAAACGRRAHHWRRAVRGTGACVGELPLEQVFHVDARHMMRGRCPRVLALISRRAGAVAAQIDDDNTPLRN